jgi:hypothetical protein
MRHLVRPRFLDLPWGAAEFDELAEFWLRQYERADEKTRFRALPYHALEIRLRGFPRRRADDVEAELCRRFFTPAFPEPLVWRPDPDTLAFTSGFAPLTEQPAPGLGLPLLEGEPFYGLLAEVRFTASGFRRAPEEKSKVQGTVVLVGELRGGHFFAKSAWKVGPTGWEDEPQWGVAWGGEPTLLGALSKFRVTGTVPDDLAKTSFTFRWIDRVALLGIACTNVPCDRPRLGGLLLRLPSFAAAFALGGHLAAILLVTGWWCFLWWLPLFWLLVVAWLFWEFLKVELQRFFVGRAVFRRVYARLYSKPAHIIPLLPPEAAERLDNPWARKYTDELLALGCTHAGVFRLDREESGRSAMSPFLAPDGVTYFFLMLALGGSAPGYEPVVHEMWPAAVVLLAVTLFPDGARFASANNRHDGFRRKRTGPEWQFRVFPDASDPGEFLDRHGEAMRRFAAATGRAPALHVSAEEFLRRQGEFDEAVRQVYKDAPYSWSDHLHRYLHLVRREYRENNNPAQKPGERGALAP